jgi:hypothetical protein
MTSITSALLAVLLMSPPFVRRDVATDRPEPIDHHAPYAATRARCELSWSLSWSTVPMIMSTAL